MDLGSIAFHSDITGRILCNGLIASVVIEVARRSFSENDYLRIELFQLRMGDLS